MELSFTPPDSDAAVDWAVGYSKTGMAGFPVGADKKPLTIHGLKDAATDELQIRAWWARYPHADIGWAVPASIVVVDLDCKADGDGFEEFMAREGAHPDSMATPQASTPSGGRHLVYAACGAASYRNNVRLNGAAIDLRTAGGYIVLPGPKNGRRWLKELAPPLAGDKGR